MALDARRRRRAAIRSPAPSSLRVTGIPFAMVTLAFAQAGIGAGAAQPDGVTGGDEGLAPRDTRARAGLPRRRGQHPQPLLARAGRCWSWCSSWSLDRAQSRAGHVAAAVRENELRVRVLGLRPYRGQAAGLRGRRDAGLRRRAWSTCCCSAAPSPRAVSADLTITLLVMVVLGGVGSRWGAVIGGVVYTLLDQRLTALANSEAIAGLPPSPARPAVRAAVHPRYTVHPRGALHARGIDRRGRQARRAAGPRGAGDPATSSRRPVNATPDGLHTLGRWTRTAPSPPPSGSRSTTAASR